MPSELPQLNVRLQPAVHALALKLSEELGVSQSAVISQAIRLLARREGVEAAREKNPKKSPKSP